VLCCIAPLSRQPRAQHKLCTSTYCKKLARSVLWLALDMDRAMVLTLTAFLQAAESQHRLRASLCNA
jgi:hypothetical protein